MTLVQKTLEPSMYELITFFVKNVDDVCVSTSGAALATFSFAPENRHLFFSIQVMRSDYHG